MQMLLRSSNLRGKATAMLKRISFALFAIGLLTGAYSLASAQERLRLAWAGFSPTNSPIWVIEDRKLLQKMGVQPEIIAINASPTVLQALLANEIEAASISVTTLTSSRLAGADTVINGALSRDQPHRARKHSARARG